jgi:gas vesicle protein
MKNSNIAEKKSSNFGLVVGSVLVGAAVGSIVALLYAPLKGKDLRHDISDKADEFTESMKSKFNSILKEAKSEYETEKAKAKMQAKEVKENVKDFAGNMKA